MKNRKHLELIVLSTTAVLLIAYAGIHFSTSPLTNKTTLTLSETHRTPAARIEQVLEPIHSSDKTNTRVNKPSTDLLAAATSAFAEKAAESLVFDPESGESLTEIPQWAQNEHDPSELEEESRHQALAETGDMNHQVDHEAHLAVEAPEEFVLALQKH